MYSYHRYCINIYWQYCAVSSATKMNVYSGPSNNLYFKLNLNYVNHKTVQTSA